MTKEELDRIKKAYSSGLKVQIWFNGYWEDFDARDYSMYSDPFSENRQYRIVGSDYADIAEKRIAELEETCNKWFEHLKNREEELLNELNNQNVKYNKQIEELEDKLANADYQLEGRDIKIKELEAQIEKMKCCGNCAKNGHICVAEEIQGKLCGKNKDKWELRR